MQRIGSRQSRKAHPQLLDCFASIGRLTNQILEGVYEYLPENGLNTSALPGPNGSKPKAFAD